MSKVRFDVATLTLNPALDRTLTIPRFEAGEVHRVQQERCEPAGKGVNVAVALAAYGLRVAVTGLLGSDNDAMFEALFARARIADCFVRIAGSTRVCIKVTDPVLHRTTDINLPGLAPEPAHLEALWSALAGLDARCFVLAGSVPAGVEPALYRELVCSLRARGQRVVVDTSGEALRHALEAKPHVVKPNRHELEALVGRPLTSEHAVLDAARALVADGVELVAVSLGRDGACFVDASSAVIARPPEVEVESTVGAGDAMVAGLVAGELAGCSLEERARLATAFAVDALTHRGPRESSRSAVHGALGTVQLV